MLNNARDSKVRAFLDSKSEFKNVEILKQINGTSNTTLKIIINNKLWALRVMSAQRYAANTREEEASIWHMASDYNLAPKLHYWSQEHDYCLSQWIDTDMTAILAKQAIDSISRFHQLPISCSRANYLAQLTGYINHLGGCAEEAQLYFHRLINLLSDSQFSWSLCHHDLGLSNIIFTQDQAYFCDFEYSQIGHPFLDVEYLSTQLPGVTLARYAKSRGVIASEGDYVAWEAAGKINAWMGWLWANYAQDIDKRTFEDRLETVEPNYKELVNRWQVLDI